MKKRNAVSAESNNGASSTKAGSEGLPMQMFDQGKKRKRSHLPMNMFTKRSIDNLPMTFGKRENALSMNMFNKKKAMKGLPMNMFFKRSISGGLPMNMFSKRENDLPMNMFSKRTEYEHALPMAFGKREDDLPMNMFNKRNINELPLQMVFHKRDLPMNMFNKRIIDELPMQMVFHKRDLPMNMFNKRSIDELPMQMFGKRGTAVPFFGNRKRLMGMMADTDLPMNMFNKRSQDENDLPMHFGKRENDLPMNMFNRKRSIDDLHMSVEGKRTVPFFGDSKRGEVMGTEEALPMNTMFSKRNAYKSYLPMAFGKREDGLPMNMFNKRNINELPMHMVFHKRDLPMNMFNKRSIDELPMQMFGKRGTAVPFFGSRRSSNEKRGSDRKDIDDILANIFRINHRIKDSKKTNDLPMPTFNWGDNQRKRRQELSRADRPPRMPEYAGKKKRSHAWAYWPVISRLVKDQLKHDKVLLENGAKQ